MKYLFIFLMLILSTNVFAQFELDAEDIKLLNPTSINEHPLTKDVAFDIIILKLAQICNSANDVVQFKDKESGQIVVKPLGDVHYGLFNASTFTWPYTLTITIKNNKIKYVIDSQGINNDYLVEEISEYYTNLINELQFSLINYVDDGF